MKIAITAVASIVVTALLMFALMNSRFVHREDKAELDKLRIAQETVQKNFRELSAQIQAQLEAFADVVASHKEFSLKILVENDRSSPVVTEMASQFMRPMGFSALEITDSSGMILSSGHFPASAGNRSAEKADILSGKAAVYTEDIMGTPTLTLQTEKNFSIAGFRFHVAGGLTVDTALLARLTPAGNVTLVLKKGSDYLGMNGISSVSAIKDHRIIINDKKYLASEFRIPSAGFDETISLIVLVGGRK